MVTAVAKAIHATQHEVGGFDPITPAGIGAEIRGGIWADVSPLGSSKRTATDLLMSTFDTNPASTDQTTAFASAFAAALTLINNGYGHVRILLDSRQTYTIAGAVTAGAHGEWAQLPLPYSNAKSGCIELVGIPMSNDYAYIGGGTSGTVIKSTLGAAPAYDSARGIASVIGGPASFSSARTPTTIGGARNYLRFKFTNITVRSSSPVIAGIDGGWVNGLTGEGLVQFDRDDMAAANPATALVSGLPGQLGLPCVAPQAIPIIFPFSLDWYGSIAFDTLVCAGWLGGPLIGEFADIRHLVTFYTSKYGGPSLGVDGSNQVTRIGRFTDWNNGIGIGAYAAPVASLSTYAVSPTTPSIAAGAATPAATLEIGVWEAQYSQNGPFNADTQRVFDVVDGSDLIPIDAEFIATDDGGGFYVSPGHPGYPNIYAGGTGITLNKSIRNKWASRGSYTSIAVPASGTPIRNPIGRDALVTVTSGNGASNITITVDGSVWGTGELLVPANGLISVTYPAGSSPTWAWQVI